MKTPLYKLGFILFAFLCLLIGLYPMVYFLPGSRPGFFDNKAQELLASVFWQTAFYGHILFGGTALLSGCTQFSARIRRKRLRLHRSLGKVYVASVGASGTCALYLGLFANGGWLASLGFICLGLVWLSTTFLAFSAIRKLDLARHQDMMTYSYAACFAAVTLRLWLPLLVPLFGAFEPAYIFISWWCWVPNLLVAHGLVHLRRKARLATHVQGL